MQSLSTSSGKIDECNWSWTLTDPGERAWEGAVRSTHEQHAAKVPHAGETILGQRVQEDETDQSNCQASDDARGALLDPIGQDARGESKSTGDGVADGQ